MAGLSLLSNAQDSQLRIIHVVEDKKMDEEENVVRNQSLDDSDAVMEDLNFIMFGDMGETDTANGLEIATIHSSRSKLFFPRPPGSDSPWMHRLPYNFL